MCGFQQEPVLSILKKNKITL